MKMNIMHNLMKMNTSKVSNNLLKSHCEFEGLGKVKKILTVNMTNILLNHQSGSQRLENKIKPFIIEDGKYII